MLAGCAAHDKVLVEPAAVPRTAEPSTQPCDLHEKVTAHLAKKYGEAVTALGVSNYGALVEVLANLETGTWTIIVTAPGGPACLVGAGEGWRTIDKLLPQGTAL